MVWQRLFYIYIYSVLWLSIFILIRIIILPSFFLICDMKNGLLT